MKQLLISTLFIALATANSWAQADQNSQAPDPKAKQQQPQQFTQINRAVAIVNNEAITQHQLDEQTKIAKAKAEHSGLSMPDDTALKKQVLQQMIIQRVGLQLAKVNNIEINASQIEQAIQQVLSKNQITMQQLKQSIAHSGLSFDDYKTMLKDQLTIKKLEQAAVAHNINITPSEVDNYLQQQQLSANPNMQYDIEHILIALPDDPTPAKVQAVKAKAKKVRKQIDQGLDFGQAAIKYSDAPDALKGGDLGWMRRGQLPTDFVKPVSDMKSGEVKGPFKTGSGYHIIKLVGKKQPPPQQHFVTQYHIHRIIVKTSPIKSKKAAKAQAERLKMRLNNGEDFAQVARMSSNDKQTIAQGGDLGWITLDQLNPKVATQAKKMHKGEVSKPFMVGDDWYIIKFSDQRRHNNTKEYERQQARMALFNKKAEQAVKTWQAQIKGSSYVRILQPGLRKSLS